MLFEGNIHEAARTNTDFRRVIATGPHSQLVTMSIPPKEDIGSEVHPGTDQMLFIVAGAGKAVVNGESIAVEENDVVVVPAGARHNLVNTGTGRPEAVHRLRAAQPQGRHGPPSEGGRARRRARTRTGRPLRGPEETRRNRISDFKEAPCCGPSS